MEKILLTGASGFIAGHCIIDMLNHGYSVRGTVRDVSRGDRLKAFLANHTDHIDRLEFAAADLTDADSWLAAAEGCDGILHVASPVPVVQPKNADEVIRPAREGTLNVLAAAKHHGISRVVLTSSTAAVMSSNRTSGDYTEDDWTDLGRTDLSPYVQSKTIAERAAWDFVADNGGLTLSTVNPGLVLGPALESDYGSSLESLVLLMNSQYPMLPRIGFECVDVRDVASLHRLAYERPEAAGRRFLCTNGFRWLSDIANQIKREFPDYADIPSREMPNWLVRIAAVFMAEVAQFAKDVNQVRSADNSPALAIGWQPRDVDEAIRAGAQSLIEHGIVSPKKK